MATTTQTVTSAGLQTAPVRLSNDHSSHPPIEKFLTIDGLLKSHAADPAEPPLICYPAKGVSDYEEHTAKALDSFTDAACARYIELGLEPADASQEKAPVVALLATSSLETIITTFALSRLGWAVLFLSTRLTAPAYARLMGMADCSTIITSEAFQATAKEINDERPCKMVPLLCREDYRNRQALPFTRDCDPVKESRKLAWIVHSSGSTGFPKPIFLTHYQCLANFRKSFAKRVFCVSPLFHSHALMELGRAFYMKQPMYFGNYAFPVTGQNLLEAMKVAKPEQVSAVPYVLKLLAETDNGIAELAKAQLVLYGGSSCPDDLGDRLVSKGVNLVANYGATETGQIMTSFRPPGDIEWSYMRLHRPVADYTLMDEIAPGVFECVALDGLPSKGPSNSDNPPNSFRTADLFTRHPDPAKSNFYKYLARLDDRITLVNGEKVLPIPLEGRIREDELVREAAVFGFQRTVPGVIIFKSERAAEIPDDEFLDAVWPSVEAANIRAESFSRIPRELVIVKGADVVYPRTDKGTFIRAQLYQQFADDIDRTYQAFEHDQSGTMKLSTAELEVFLLERFRKDLRVPLPDAETDIFSAGVDSLQTTRMWRIIKQNLDLGAKGDSVSQNVVFEKGNVRALARHLFQLRTGEVAEDENELDAMREMIDKYSHFTQHFATSRVPPEKDVVLVTGATGNLGAWIVAELVKRSHVAEVWALVRAPGQAAAGARLMQSLASRNIQLTDTESAKLRALPSDLSEVNLGLEAHQLQHLLSSLTCVIHSAWAVNFNLGVRSFEGQHIRGAHNLINLCLRVTHPTPAKFFFCSSVSAASGTPRPATITESAVEDLSHAQNMGYGRSKLVTEHIVRNAMRGAGLHARVLRIGQLSGDRVNADWNETEAVALMIRSALTVNALPALDERPSWLPVDLCAEAILDIAFPESGQLADDSDLVYHLINPRLFSWKQDFLPALKRTSLPAFDVVSPAEWLERLKRSEQDPAKNPSIKLIDFWQRKYGAATDKGDESQAQQDVEAPGLRFETFRTEKDCRSVATAVDPVSDGLIERYVEAWLKKWAPQ
ncbi:hypothetical protein LTR36_007043 [Oleoguttula mirabilis]|uniref:Polyketide synthase-like phosphopantetheine-binding domain-containing protein n=1 Tax=Oleoguttula mirabilis TaxID=1507867 RepID=A0AAV9JBM4_9PEZI|nr:hypothetical protein LTR36_007043 [Oleoguttula mirabilis]